MAAPSLGPLAVDATAWLALLLYPAVFIGAPSEDLTKSFLWPRRLFVLGGAVFAVHVVLAFIVHYELSHEVALGEVAEQTEALTGVASGAGLYLNYLFAGLWLVEAIWWSFAAASYCSRPAVLAAAIHAFFLFMILNGAVVFVPWPRRALGLAILLVCLVAMGRRLLARRAEVT
ncbi:MAG: hypothetical protein AAGK22_30575 [Acidobacteriota bacterium]